MMLFVTLELSLASPGATSAWAILFTVLGMSMTYSMFEQYEAAYKLDGMKESSGNE